ncbi:hypothetical protein [Candidatus Phyllobacterium onerii]|uniref:hypothetical protein n=1 Tax=Candidatus Phyllobacterium onerii TaxID=3020828 RepID=UPI00232E0AC4|nr:hypothetical protein [Phyllobacterium sp. IY22]
MFSVLRKSHSASSGTVNTLVIIPNGIIQDFIYDYSKNGPERFFFEQLAALTGVGVLFVRELEAAKDSYQIGRALQVAATLGLRVSVGSRRERVS